MLTLSGKVIRITDARNGRSTVVSISTNRDLPEASRPQRAFLALDEKPLPAGFGHYFTFSAADTHSAATLLKPEFRYLADGDVVAVQDDRIRSLYRVTSSHNSLLLTERCDNYCLMCSQPPKRIDDDWILDEAFKAIRLIPRTAKTLGFTGGEPTLYGDRFISLVRHTKHWLPDTSLHILSNGRSFANKAFAREYAAVEHPDAMVGIPLYAADPSVHDYVVQARGAFDETVRGILNLKEAKQQVELRIVLHKQTTPSLAEWARFVTRNLLFVDHVALMGLEMTGFTRANLNELWIDPLEYRDQVTDAVEHLRGCGIRTSIYNLPLCLVDDRVAANYVRSISDWKNEYPHECGPCERKSECGGFFSSALQHGYSQSIKPFL
jgi:His-Xaa-Ser system radical SAM maturase HxsC